MERLTRDRAKYWLAQQRKFMADRGTTRWGYIAHYTAIGETDIDRIISIHDADTAYLRKLMGLAVTG